MRVLIVDDHRVNRKLLRSQLEAEGHVVLEANNGSEALGVLGLEAVDAVITDVLMPRMDGFRLCHEIRKRESVHRTVPLILYTATFNEPTDRQLAHNVGADCYVVKPGSGAAIIAALAEVQLIPKDREIVARTGADAAAVLEQYSGTLASKLETRSAELSEVLSELQEAHEEILQLNRTLESRVEQRTAALNAANQELEAFSSSIAHDLRTPLLNITGFAGLLEEMAAPRLNSSCRDSLARIISSAARMNKLIEALLEFARLGRDQLKPAEIELEDTVEEALQVLRPDCEGRNIQWQRKRLPRATADPILLRQVFVNLIGNAIKYTRTRDPAVIEIGWRAGRAGELVVFVRDNGVGFDMQQAQALFGVFKRISGVDAFEGIGIGLANAHRIVTRHGGRIWAEAEVGRGATFSFTLLRADRA